MIQQRKPLEKTPLRSDIHKVENEREDELRDESFWRNNIDALVEAGGVKDSHIFSEFVEQRKQLLDMADRFWLLTENPRYRGVVTDVELGLETTFDTDDELDSLKDRYIELLTAIRRKVGANAVQEIAREDPNGRSFAVRPTTVTPEHLVVARNRVLAIGNIAAANSLDLQFAIKKRMVFEMPTGMYQTLVGDDVRLTGEASRQKLESQLDLNSEYIYPIRTSYSAISRLATDEYDSVSSQ